MTERSSRYRVFPFFLTFLPSCTIIWLLRSYQLSVPHAPQQEYWAPLPKLWSFPFPIVVSYTEAVCFELPVLFPIWMRFLALANSLGSPFPLLSWIAWCRWLLALQLPPRSRPLPCDTTPVCCIVNLIHQRPTFRFRWFNIH